MKTSFAVSKEAFCEFWDCYMAEKSYQEQLAELLLVFENNDGQFYSNFMQSRRMKAHGAAFYSAILAVKPFLPNGYYIDNSHIKRLLKEASGMDYRDYLAPLGMAITESREELLKEL